MSANKIIETDMKSLLKFIFYGNKEKFHYVY